MEDSLIAGYGCAGPRVSSKVKRVLVSLGLVLIFEAIVTVEACVLLFHLMRARNIEIISQRGSGNAQFLKPEEAFGKNK